MDTDVKPEGADGVPTVGFTVNVAAVDVAGDAQPPDTTQRY